MLAHVLTPRRAASSLRSRTTKPAPSPSVVPGGSLNGAHGSALSTPSDENPANASRSSESAPPAMTTSACPRKSMSRPSPIAFVDDEQAVEIVTHGPPSSSAAATRSATALNSVKPWPKHVPKTSATRRWSGETPELSHASRAAASASSWSGNGVAVSSRSISVDGVGCARPSHPGHVAPMRVPIGAVSNRSTARIPLRPAHSAARCASIPVPSADAAPMPVTTTRTVMPPSRIDDGTRV